MDFNTFVQYFTEFKSLFEQSQPSLQKSKELFEQLKPGLARFGFPSLEAIPADEQARRLLLCRETLEYGILLSIKLKDIPSFERYTAQIKTFYYDYGKRYGLPASSRQWTILGLNLLHLLSKNKLDEFHTELELIPLEYHDNVFIKQPIYLEQCMMEGSYNKVTKARNDIPSDSYALFMDILMETVREQISDCISKSFTTLPPQETQKLLGFNDVTQFKLYTEQKNWEKATVNGKEVFVFQRDESKKVEIEPPVMLKRLLQYAKEMERIV